MPKEKEELEEKEEANRFAFKIMQYKLYAGPRQYSVYDATGENKEKGTLGSLKGYFYTVTEALSSIRQDELRKKTTNTQTLDKAIDAMLKFDLEFKKLLEPLKKFEEK